MMLSGRRSRAERKFFALSSLLDAASEGDWIVVLILVSIVVKPMRIGTMIGTKMERFAASLS